jgi:methyl-CpG-binding domain protein 4
MIDASELKGQDVRRITRSMALATTTCGRSTALVLEAEDKTVSNRNRKRIAVKLEQENKITKTRTKAGQSRHGTPPLDATTFGLIQESIAHNLYHLCIQAMLWNQTSGRQARPIFFKLIQLYPTPAHLAEASLSELTALLQPLGLHNIRARRCILFAQKWLELPPEGGKIYVRKGYPARGAEEGYEIAHLPGMGPYAIDSFRIFHRDEMRGVASSWLGEGAGDNFEPEWMRVVPLDKELKAYVKWQWLKRGKGERVCQDVATTSMKTEE